MADMEKSGENLLRILEEDESVLLLVDREEMVVACTAGCEALFGAPRDKIVSARIWTLLTGLDPIEILAELGDSGKWRTDLTLPRGRFECSLCALPAQPERGFVVQIRTGAQLQGADERAVLAGIGRFGAKLGHDLNNLFGSMRGSLDLMKRKISKLSPSENPAERQIELMESALRKGTELASKIRAYLRPDIVDSRKTRLSEVITEVVARFAAAGVGAENFEISVDVNPEIEINEVAIVQVLYGLCQNSIEAMRGLKDRQVVIFLEGVDLTEDFGEELPAGKYVRLSVMDHGEGLSELACERIFEPFFSTKPSEIGKGFGLSLAMAREVMRNHGGDLMLFSEPKCGTVAHCFFPLASRPKGAK